MPNGQVEYWFTELVFVIGDKIERNGDTWIVTSVGETDGAAKHMTVTVRRDGDSPLPQ